MLISLPKGGSPIGLSLAKSQVKCGRRAYLDAQASVASETGSVGGDGPNIGTLCHAMLEQYELGNLDNSNLAGTAFGPDGHPTLANPEWQIEAKRLMKWWFSVMPRGYFGEMQAVEHPLPPDDASWVKLQQLFQGRARTARIDLLTRIDERVAARLADKHHVDVEPGLWICDYKVVSKRSYESYLNDLQALYYPWAYDTCYPEDRVKGMLFIFLVRTKVPDIGVFRVEMPNDTEKRIVSDFLHMEETHRAVLGRMANPTACYDWGKPCWWLASGKCDRTNREMDGDANG